MVEIRREAATDIDTGRISSVKLLGEVGIYIDIGDGKNGPYDLEKTRVLFIVRDNKPKLTTLELPTSGRGKLRDSTAEEGVILLDKLVSENPRHAFRTFLQQSVCDLWEREGFDTEIGDRILSAVHTDILIHPENKKA